MQSHCHPPAVSSCHPAKKKFDYILWGSLLFLAPFYIGGLLNLPTERPISLWHSMAQGSRELLDAMWWGILLGIIFVGLLNRVPRELVLSAMGGSRGASGIARAIIGGVLLDLCSHGILLVGMKMYERGISLGQTLAFLIASPWNSLSLTFIMLALIGWEWTLLFIALSVIIAFVTGMLADICVSKGKLPTNPHTIALPEGYAFWPNFCALLRRWRFSLSWLKRTLKEGLIESRMVLRWILFGVVLAVLIRTFMPTEHFGTYFGPTLLGLGLTILVATIIEVCSEGSMPIAADLLTRAHAPGNAFAFLMTGVATDYTEILALKETTRSWKIAFFLPLITTPQVLLLAWMLNQHPY